MNIDKELMQLATPELKPSPFDPRDKHVDSLLTADDTFDEKEFNIFDDETLKVYNQGQTGMCTAFSAAQFIRHFNYLTTGKLEDFSFGFIYGNRKNPEKTSEGETLVATLSQLRKYGVCKLKDFDFTGSYEEVREQFVKLSDKIKESAKEFKLKSFYRLSLTKDDELPRVLTKYKHIVYAGIPIYSSFYSSFKDGIVPIPKKGEKFYGGHAVVISGYKYINKVLHAIVINSWGDERGDNGKFYIPVKNFPWYEMWLPFDYEKMHLTIPVDSDTFYNNGKEIKAYEKSFILNDRMMVPLRTITDIYNLEVEWNNEYRTIMIKEYADKIWMQIGNKQIVNMQSVSFTNMDVAPIIRNDRTFIPLRFLSEVLGLKVSWDNDNRQAIITNY